jgi:hypothetical protein
MRASSFKVGRRLAPAVLAVFSSFILFVPPARAGLVLGVDVENYILLYEGGGAGNHLSINNFGTPTSRVWTGDIGIAGHGLLAASGPGTLFGNIDFAASNTGQASISNTTIDGTVSYGVSNVQTIMNNLNSLSTSLGALHASGTSLVISTSSPQTVSATGGTSELINGVSYRLFNVTSLNTNNGQNLIIKGDGSDSVVLDISAPNPQFKGNILLEDLNGKFFGDAGYAGLSPDQLIINIYGGANLTGGPTLSVNNQGDSAHPNNIIYGTFLDPNGTISMVNTRFVGRDFGGDSHDMQIVSGDTLSLPPPVINHLNIAVTPEPSSAVILGSLGAVMGVVLFIRRLLALSRDGRAGVVTGSGYCRDISPRA